MGIPHLAVCSFCKKPNRVLNFTRVTQATCQNCRGNLALLADPLLFQTVFDHQLLSVIGMGGMGKVYLAQNTKWKNYVAVKAQIHHETSKTQREHFWNEARILKDFDHPNIIKFVGAIETETGSFLFMEYFPSLKLSQFVLQHFPLSTTQTITILQEICLALFHVHQRGYIHRDLKPNNILIGEANALRLIDFGISVTKGAPLIEEKAMGTLSYMAPEQFFNKELDERTDIYAIGSILFFMLTGQKPFEGAISPYQIRQDFQESLTSLIKKPHQHPKPFLKLLEKMTYPEKEKRFSSISEILEELHHLHQKELSSSLSPKQKRPHKIFSFISANTSGDFWEAVKIPTKPFWMSWQSGSVGILFLLLFGILGHSFFFSHASLSNTKKNQTPNSSSDTELLHGLPQTTSNTEFSYSPITMLEQNLTLSQLNLFLKTYPEWEPVREKTFRLRLSALKEPLLPVFLEFFKQEYSQEIWTGATLLWARFDWNTFPVEWIEFILEPKNPVTNRKKLFEWMLSQKMLSLLLPYYQSPEMANVLVWASKEELFSQIQWLLQKKKDFRLFEWIQFCAEPNQLLLEIQGIAEEGELRRKIVEKYQKADFSEKQIDSLFLKSASWKKLCEFLLILQTEKSITQLWRLLSKVPFYSEKGQFLWGYLKDQMRFVNLEMEPFLKYVTQFKEPQERKVFVQKLHQVSGINLSFVFELEIEYRRLRQLQGSLGFQIGWQQDLAGFLLASLSKNFAFEAFYFEKLQKNQSANITVLSQLESSRTSPLFFQELLKNWLILRYPDANPFNVSTESLIEKRPLSQYREGLEKLVAQLLTFFEENAIEEAPPEKISVLKHRYKIRQTIATTELQKIVGSYYTVVELLSLLAPELVKVRVYNTLKKQDPLCKNAEEQILLAIHLLSVLLYQFDSSPLFLLEED